MPALDDYERPIPAWLVVAAVLARAPEGLSVSRIVALANRLSGGRGPHQHVIRRQLARMVEDGSAVLVVCSDGTRRTPSHLHQLTDAGRDLFEQAAALTLHALTETTPNGTQQPQDRRRKQARAR